MGYRLFGAKLLFQEMHVLLLEVVIFRNIQMYNIQTQLNLWYALYIIGGIREANSHEAGDQKYMITIEDRAMGVFYVEYVLIP